MAPPSLPQPLGRLPRDRLAGSPEYPRRHSPQSGMFALPATPASVGAARRKVRDLLDAWSVGADTTDNALLVTSELVTNALTHTASERVVCRLRLSAGRLHIEVEDENRAGNLPAQRRPGPDEQCGRGLLLVGMVSSDWGVRDAPHGTGRIVWSELPVDQDEPAEAAPPTAPGAATASVRPVTPVTAPAAASPTASAEASVPVVAAAPADSAAAAPDAPAPVRPAPALPPTPPAAHAVPAAAPASWHPPAPHRTRPVPHSAEGTASHGPYGPYGTTAPHHSPYSRS